MKKINLGRVEVISRTSLDHRQSDSDAQKVVTRPQITSLEEAQKLVDFEIWQPTYLPSPELKLVQVLAVISSQSREVVNTTLKYKDSSNGWMAIEQRPLGAQEETLKVFVPFEIWEGNIRDRPVAFYTHPVEAKDHPNGQISILHCRWEYEDFIMDLQGPQLSPEEVGQIVAC